MSRFISNKEIVKHLNNLVDEYRDLRFNQIFLNFILGVDHQASLETWYELFHEESDVTLDKIKANIAKYSDTKKNKEEKNQLTLF